MGLTYIKRYRLEIELPARWTAAAELPAGYCVWEWDESLLQPHAATKYRAFCQEMDAFIFPSLGDAEGCLGLMRDITRREDFVREATWLVAWQPAASEPPEYCGTIQGIRTGPLAGSLQNVGVVPEHRGRGLGRWLMVRSLAGFRSAGIRRVSLEVTARNRAAQRLYRRLGFRRVRTVYKTVQVAYAGGPR